VCVVAVVMSSVRVSNVCLQIRLRYEKRGKMNAKRITLSRVKSHEALHVHSCCYNTQGFVHSLASRLKGMDDMGLVVVVVVVFQMFTNNFQQEATHIHTHTHTSELEKVEGKWGERERVSIPLTSF